ANQRANALDDLGNRQAPLHPRQVHTAFAHEVLDIFETIALVPRIQPHAADRPARLNESETLVLSERLRVHAEHPGRHAYEKKILIQGCAAPSIGVDTHRFNVGEGKYGTV